MLGRITAEALISVIRFWIALEFKFDNGFQGVPENTVLIQSDRKCFMETNICNESQPLKIL